MATCDRDNNLKRPPCREPAQRKRARGKSPGRIPAGHRHEGLLRRPRPGPEGAGGREEPRRRARTRAGQEGVGADPGGGRRDLVEPGAHAAERRGPATRVGRAQPPRQAKAGAREIPKRTGPRRRRTRGLPGAGAVRRESSPLVPPGVAEGGPGRPQTAPPPHDQVDRRSPCRAARDVLGERGRKGRRDGRRERRGRRENSREYRDAAEAHASYSGP